MNGNDDITEGLHSISRSLYDLAIRVEDAGESGKALQHLQETEEDRVWKMAYQCAVYQRGYDPANASYEANEAVKHWRAFKGIAKTQEGEEDGRPLSDH